MKQYKALLRSWFKGDPDPDSGSIKILPEYEQAVRTAVPFVLNPEVIINLDKVIEFSPPYDGTKPLDLPFKVCSFELSGNPFDRENKRIAAMFTEAIITEKRNGAVLCFLIHEITPNKYNYWWTSAKNNVLITTTVQQYHPDDSQDNALKAISYALLQTLNQTCVTEKVNDIVKCRVKGKNQIIRINQVVRIYAKSTHKSDLVPMYGGKMEFSHRWTVRGHWRNIRDQIGKDRERNPIQGYTWVKDHIKGPEGKILVRKTRAVGDYDTTRLI